LPKSVHIHYYALLRERAGMGQEVWTSQAHTGAELYEEIARRHGFGLGRDRMRLAVNDEFVDWSTPLSDGDHVAFIPPVAGG
jgi:molybdopterin converting factor subunit 1